MKAKEVLENKNSESGSESDPEEMNVDEDLFDGLTSTSED